MAQTQGGRANRASIQFKQEVEACFINCGYTRFPTRLNLLRMADTETPVYATNVKIGRNIYDSARRCDFLLIHPQKWPWGLVIEAKWQQSSGSVDEKYPFLVLNIRQSHFKTILLLDGGGYRAGAECWLRSQVDGNLLHVFNMSQFQTWVNQGNI